MPTGSDTQWEGGCACGAVRYRLLAKPMYVHCCHCTWCQREAGSAFAVNAMIEANRVATLRGEPELVVTPSNSGKNQNFWRCPDCKIAVWSHYGGLGDKVNFVRVGSLDEGHDLSPDIHIYTSTKQPWVVIPDNSLTADEFYDMKALWPEESLARLGAALK